MNRYSTDLREKVVAYVDAGHSRLETSKVFGININSVYRWLKLREKTGSLDVKLVPRSPHKLHLNILKEYMRTHSDSTQKEISKHFGCCIAAVCNALKKLGFTYKKNKGYIEKGMKIDENDSRK